LLGLLLLGFGLHLALALQLLVLASLAHGLERGELLLLGGDGTGGVVQSLANNRDDILVSVLDTRLELGLSGIALLGLVLAEREQEQFGLVGLEAVDVGVQRLSASVLATVVDGDADGQGLLAGNAGSFELIESETSSQADLVVVTLGRGVHDGAQQTGGRAREALLGLLGSVGASADSAGRLVEPGPDVLLPVLTVMTVGGLIVVLDRHG